MVDSLQILMLADEATGVGRLVFRERSAERMAAASRILSLGKGEEGPGRLCLCLLSDFFMTHSFALLESRWVLHLILVFLAALLQIS